VKSIVVRMDPSVQTPGADACGSSYRCRELGFDRFDQAVRDGVAHCAGGQRGRGERKRPSSGWASLTPTERDVVGLVSEGLGNKDIATRLFISPRTVATHLTHADTKLGLASRVQLALEATRATPAAR
jgi:DNA-binding CsgD family transcriptional regulator